jgi:hypothetical protein
MAKAVPNQSGKRRRPTLQGEGERSGTATPLVTMLLLEPALLFG